jgi:hypothetical protein
MLIVGLDRLRFGGIPASLIDAETYACGQRCVRATADKPFKLPLALCGHSVTPQIPVGENVAIRL